MRGYGQALKFVSVSVYQNGFCVLVSAEREVMGHDCTCEYCHGELAIITSVTFVW